MYIMCNLIRLFSDRFHCYAVCMESTCHCIKPLYYVQTMKFITVSMKYKTVTGNALVAFKRQQELLLSTTSW